VQPKRVLKDARKPGKPSPLREGSGRQERIDHIPPLLTPLDSTRLGGSSGASHERKFVIEMEFLYLPPDHVPDRDRASTVHGS